MATITKFSQKAHDDCIALLDGLQFDGELHKDGLPAAYVARLIELFGNLFYLLNGSKVQEHPAIFRSFLETYVEFANLNSNENYYGHTYARFHEDRLRLLKSAQRGNPYLAKILAGICRRPEIPRRELASIDEARLSRIERKGALPAGRHVERVRVNLSDGGQRCTLGLGRTDEAKYGSSKSETWLHHYREWQRKNSIHS